MVLHARVVRGVGGGPEKTILNSPRFLEPLGYRAICAYMRHPRDHGFIRIERKAKQYGAKLIPVDDRGPWDVGVITRMLRICKQQHVAIWHGHDYKSNVLGLILKRFWPMHLVTTVHGWVKFTWRTPLYYAIDRMALRRYERVICVSQDLHERCAKARVRSQRLILLPNAIDTQRIRRTWDVASAKQRIGVPPKHLVIGAVGRLSQEKGFDNLIQAVDRLLQAGVECQLIIVGDGEARQSLKNLVSELNRADRIRLVGYRDDIAHWMQAMDVFALSSRREGLPNVVLEAMAYEVPVVATRVAGIPSLIRNEETGVLVDEDDVASLAVALMRVLRDAKMRARMAKAARALIEVDYSFHNRMQRMASIYDELRPISTKPVVASS